MNVNEAEKSYVLRSGRIIQQKVTAANQRNKKKVDEKTKTSSEYCYWCFAVFVSHLYCFLFGRFFSLLVSGLNEEFSFDCILLESSVAFSHIEFVLACSWTLKWPIDILCVCVFVQCPHLCTHQFRATTTTIHKLTIYLFVFMYFQWNWTRQSEHLYTY